jgi:hypothetical protein
LHGYGILLILFMRYALMVHYGQLPMSEDLDQEYPKEYTLEEIRERVLNCPLAKMMDLEDIAFAKVDREKLLERVDRLESDLKQTDREFDTMTGAQGVTIERLTRERDEAYYLLTSRGIALPNRIRETREENFEKFIKGLGETWEEYCVRFPLPWENK